MVEQYGVHIVGGSIAKQTEQGVTNTMYVVNNEGRLVNEYSKVHLFQLMDEHKYLVAGNETCEFKLDDVDVLVQFVMIFVFQSGCVFILLKVQKFYLL